MTHLIHGGLLVILIWSYSYLIYLIHFNIKPLSLMLVAVVVVAVVVAAVVVEAAAVAVLTPHPRILFILICLFRG